MIKHKPIPKTDVRIDNIVYKCNSQGIVELPEAYSQFNPVKEKPRETKKRKVAKDEQD